MEYRAIALRQLEGQPDVVLFAAKPHDLLTWCGIPQRERLDGRETVGFQREENPERLSQLSAFMSDARNVVQNPLLIAARDLTKIKFVADDDRDSEPVRAGVLMVDGTGLSGLSMQELILLVLSSLEARLPALRTAPAPELRVRELQLLLDGSGDNVSEPSPDAEDSDASSDSESQDVGGVFSEETHILEFWQELKARLLLIEGLSGSELEPYLDEFLGFSRESLLAYVMPALVVDGQHRLKAAAKSAGAAAEALSQRDTEAQDRVADGADPAAVLAELRDEAARLLPVSLLLNDSPSEHVFQFVVVNQKATPVSKPLLGTIVATSLGNDELPAIMDRLQQAGIQLEESRAVAFLRRDSRSPFAGLVQSGMSDEVGNLLPFSVLAGLVKTSRELRGARLYHSPRIDQADRWRRTGLLESGFVSKPELPEALAEWQKIDGPWRDFFLAFFGGVRDRLGDAGNPAAGNYWGSTASNLYNKVTLNILLADFMQYMSDGRISPSDDADVAVHVEAWLEGVDKNYFARDWRLAGIKKDTPGIRAQWSELWVDYRKDPVKITDVREFRKSKVV